MNKKLSQLHAILLRLRSFTFTTYIKLEKRRASVINLAIGKVNHFGQKSEA